MKINKVNIGEIASINEYAELDFNIVLLSAVVMPRALYSIQALWYSELVRNANKM